MLLTPPILDCHRAVNANVRRNIICRAEVAVFFRIGFEVAVHRRERVADFFEFFGGDVNVLDYADVKHAKVAFDLGGKATSSDGMGLTEGVADDTVVTGECEDELGESHEGCNCDDDGFGEDKKGEEGEDHAYADHGADTQHGFKNGHFILSDEEVAVCPEIGGIDMLGPR